MAPKSSKPKKASAATPLALYKRGLTAMRGWSPLTSAASDTEALTALTAAARGLQARMGFAAASDANGDADMTNGHAAAAPDGEQTAVAPELAAALAAVDGLAAGMASYGESDRTEGLPVRHSVDLGLDDWEEEPAFLLASVHLALGQLLGRMFPRREAQELAQLRAALALFPAFVGGRLALAQALLARSDSVSDLTEAEALLCGAVATAARLSAAADPSGPSPGPAGPSLGPDLEPLADVMLLEASGACRREAEEQGPAAKRSLAMLLCQEGRDKEAEPLLASLDFTHRLARPVLHYPLDPSLFPAASSSGPDAPAPAGPGHERYLRAVEDALPPQLLGVLRKALSPGSRYWAEHGYGRVGYFSYMHELGSPDLSAVHQAARLLHAIAVQRFPEVANARYAEWWAHCRRHPAGHQLHFDSDDEGVGGVRNPIVSCVIYLSGGVGGPTLVTPQLLGGPLAPHGWIVHPRDNRLGIFDAAHLHGVIPGRGPSPVPGGYRITLMIAFWRDGDIKCRPRTDGLPGPSQPFPGSLAEGEGAPSASVPGGVGGADGSRGRYTWMQDLAPHPDGPAGWGTTQPYDAVPYDIPRVWEAIDGAAIQAGAAVSYDACFQGF
ncbi:hypothetical protein HYH03_015337 [Edaphochlamys debaryana]|uniref:Fe2OG dioxygenase domain-containing protein n=1 Tax=Edaphochlamys debaryana TaxID=47281 RepID=A0A836BSN9_9CHLO|nr:hypothetical protein HYH03_015337 [Edaphochlamys debaryana]|eukprot:KAG2486024.1 hypothetical protein HYH03_015337 [Edaphochlamys debaryana]